MKAVVTDIRVKTLLLISLIRISELVRSRSSLTSELFCCSDCKFWTTLHSNYGILYFSKRIAISNSLQTIGSGVSAIPTRIILFKIPGTAYSFPCIK